MPWITGKTINLGGRTYQRGEFVPQAVIDSIAPGRFGSLERLRMIQQVTPGQAEALTEEPHDSPDEEGENCPQCGAGPFRRLAQHISQMHEGAVRT